MKTVVIIPAGGAGRRMGGGIPKQYLSLAGIPILVHINVAIVISKFDAIILVQLAKIAIITIANECVVE